MKAVDSASAAAQGEGPASIRGGQAAASASVEPETHTAGRLRTGSPVRGSTMWSAFRIPDALQHWRRTVKRARTRGGLEPGRLMVKGHPS